MVFEVDLAAAEDFFKALGRLISGRGGYFVALELWVVAQFAREVVVL